MKRMIIYNDFAFYSGTLRRNSFHSHHSMQLVITRKGALGVQFGQEIIESRAILINQMVEHKILSSDGDIIVILFEPILENETLIDFEMGPYRRINEVQDLVDLIERGNYKGAVDWICSGQRRISLDIRVQDLLKHISREENCIHGLDFFEDSLNLSKSRISHLFKSETGVTFKYYLLWKRTLFAVDSFRSSGNFSDIALDCGFSDLAHFSRTFRKLFGQRPSDFFGGSASVQVDYRE